MDATQTVGLFVLAVNLISAISVLSQIRLTFHRKNSVGVSWVPWTMGTTNAFVGMVYSMLIHDLVFTLSSLAWLLVNATMVLLLIRYRNVANSTTGVG